jgi:hypothetical protein
MRSLFSAFLVILAGQLTGCASTPGGSAGDQLQGHVYSPGDKWCYRNYQVDSGAVNRTWVETVTDVNNGRVSVQRIDQVSGKYEEPTTKTWILGKGLRNPSLKVGDEWSEPILEGDRVIGQSWDRVVASEFLTTRIGRLQTFRVDSKFTRNSDEYHQMIWYSPYIGEIVRLFYVGDDGPEQGTEMTCFVPARP